MSSVDAVSQLTPQHFRNGRDFDPQVFADFLHARAAFTKAVLWVLPLSFGLIFLAMFVRPMLAAWPTVSLLVDGAFMLTILYLVFGKLLPVGKRSESLERQLGITRNDLMVASQHLRRGSVAWRDESTQTEHS